MVNNLFKIFAVVFILISCNNDMKKLNNLKNETSPYLLQHVENPVNWNPWDTKYLNKAKKENKLVIVSIGYASCHWCHVMERESFQDSTVAELMNDKFISIKVDREERPDIDSIYMASIQMISGGGGWPASIFMNSEGVPFYAGTYFPKFDRHNIPAFRSVLAKIIEIYQTNRKSVNEHSSVVYDGLKSFFDNISKNEIALNNLYPKWMGENIPSHKNELVNMRLEHIRFLIDSIYKISFSIGIHVKFFLAAIVFLNQGVLLLIRLNNPHWAASTIV